MDYGVHFVAGLGVVEHDRGDFLAGDAAVVVEDVAAKRCGFRKFCRLISGYSGRLVDGIVSILGRKIKMPSAI